MRFIALVRRGMSIEHLGIEINGLFFNTGILYFSGYRLHVSAILQNTVTNIGDVHRLVGMEGHVWHFALYKDLIIIC